MKQMLKIWLLFALAIGAATVAAETKRGLQVTIPGENGQPVKLYDASYALLIGVSDYTNGWRKLPGVAADVKAVKAALEEQGFQVEVVSSPTGAQLRQAFEGFISKHGRTLGNRLLFYFAGHGHTLKLADERTMGYIVPADAPQPVKDRVGFEDKALDMQMIEVYAKKIQAKHALFMFDSCFSGSVFYVTRAGVPEAISYKAAKPVRQLITSGSEEEPVPDQSIFREQFVAGLRGEADLNHDGYITGEELGSFLEDKVINYSHDTQHPQYGKIREPKLDKGDFVFQVPAPSTPPPSTSLKVTPMPQVKPSETAFSLDDLETKAKWQAYLQEMEAAFAQVTALEKQNMATDLKIEAWQRFMQAFGQDNPNATRDDDLRRQAQERLAYWQKQPTPKPTPTARPQPPMIQLRSTPLKVAENEMQKVFGLDQNWRPLQYIDNTFEDQGEVVVDHATGLTWQKSGSSDAMTHKEAQTYIAKLNRERFGGYSDWRLPTMPELMSLLEPTQKNGDLYIDPVFDNTQRWCWSTDLRIKGKSSSESAWYVGFSGGDVFWGNLNVRYYVRAVRP